MSGSGTFIGTTYQAGLIAHIYAHMLVRESLGWFTGIRDLPLAIAGETDGPGDDIRLTFSSLDGRGEVQAKSGLSGGTSVDEVLDRVRAKTLPRADVPVVLAIDRRTTKKIREELAADIERLRKGRDDNLHSEAERLLRAGYAAELQRIHVVSADVTRPSDPEIKLTLHQLRAALVEPDQADQALAVLVGDAEMLCANRSERTRSDLVRLLENAGIAVKPVAPPIVADRELDRVEELLDALQPAPSLVELSKLEESAVVGRAAPPATRSRLLYLRARGLLQLGQLLEARAAGLESAALDPSAPGPIRVMAMAALQAGEPDEAKRLAAQATDLSADGRSWGVRLRIATTLGEADETPPSKLEGDPDLRLVRAEIAAETGDWDSVLDLTAEDVERNRLARRLLRANAMVAPTVVAKDDRAASEAEELATTLLDEIGMSSPYASSVLLIRAEARRLLGDADSHEEDLRLAQSVAPDDAQLIRTMALSLLRRGRPADAMSVLHHATVETDASLLGLRAELEASFGTADSAKRDLDAAEALLPGADDPAEAVVLLAEAASTIGDADRAAAYLERVPEDQRGSTAYLVAMARLAWQRRDTEGAGALYARAAEQHSARGADLLLEHAIRLIGIGEIARAKATVAQINFADVDEGGLSLYSKNMYEAGELVEVQRVLEQIVGTPDPPIWAIAIATNIAILIDDPESAEQHLRTLVSRGHEPAKARILLASYLVERDQMDEAKTEVGDVLAGPISGLDRLAGAQLLLQLGDASAAVDEAFRGYRDEPHDPQAHRVFASIILAAKTQVPDPQEVAANTHVELVGDSGQSAGYSIFNDGPIDPLRGELSTTEARDMGLIGLRVGDRIDLGHRPDWAGAMKVASILPAVVHVFRDVINHYEERFPREPWFVSRFTVGEEGTLADFAPIVASLVSKKKQLETLLGLYQSSGLPLGFVAGRAGGSIGDLIEHLASSDDQPPVLVEWADPTKWGAAVDAARAQSIVITRSALHSLDSVGLLGEVAETYRIVAPRSLVRQLQRDVEEAEAQVATGSLSAYATDGGLGTTELPPNHPTLTERAIRIRRQLEWLREFGVPASRPLSSAERGGGSDLRDAIGLDSYDAVALAENDQGTLVADDIGLRIYTISGKQPPSTSTLGLIEVLVEKGQLDPDSGVNAVVRLLANRYVEGRPSVGILTAALRPALGLDGPRMSRVFRTLANPGVSLSDAVETASLAIREVAISSTLVSAGAATVVRLSVMALATRMEPRLAAGLLAARLRVHLRLVPHRLDQLMRLFNGTE